MRAASLADLRRIRGWTQEALAEKCGLSVRTIRNLETGRVNRPRGTSIELLTAALTDGTPATSTTRTPADFPVGRRKELADITELVMAERLVVICGPGGVGKTHLALEVARRVEAELQHRVAVVTLGTVPAEDAIGPMAFDHVMNATMAAIADAHARTGSPGNGCRLLVVLDNVEHILATAAAVIDSLLEADPSTHVLVTSRRALASQPARLWDVAPLAVTADRSEPSAVDLFLRYARAACPSLDLRDQTAAVIELCRRLDGLPTALEAAARLLRAVSITTMLEQDPVTLVLDQSREAALPHQRSLAASVRWSLDLLTDDSRRLLGGLARLPDPFTPEDAERDVGGLVGSDQPVTALMSSLVDESLIQVRRGHRYEYRILACVRALVNQSR